MLLYFMSYCYGYGFVIVIVSRMVIYNSNCLWKDYSIVVVIVSDYQGYSIVIVIVNGNVKVMVWLM